MALVSARAAKRRMLRAAGYRRAEGKKGRREHIRVSPWTSGRESFPALEGRGFSVARARDLIQLPPRS